MSYFKIDGLEGVIFTPYTPAVLDDPIVYVSKEKPSIRTRIYAAIMLIFEWIMKQYEQSPRIPMERMIEVTNVLHYTTPSILHREKKGDVVSVKFPFNQAEEDIRGFHAFNTLPRWERELQPLDAAQIAKANELKDSDPAIRELLEKAQKRHATSAHWKREDWNAFDRINFALIADHFVLLAHLFNTDYLDEPQRKIHEQFNVDYKESVIAQTLSFSLAYNCNLDGHTIQLPAKQANGRYVLCPYHITLHKVGKNLPYYILTPVSDAWMASPWIVFRGTVTNTKTDENGDLRHGARESILADQLDAEGVANGIITEALLTPDGLFDKIVNAYYSGRPFKATGHSLGGFLATDLMRHMPWFMEGVYSFNAPWAARSHGEDWKKKVEEGISNDSVVQWIIDGDLVPGVGRAPIGKCLAVKSVDKPFQPPAFHRRDPIFMHTQNLLTRTNIDVQEVDTERERLKPSRLVGEGVRSLSGTVSQMHLRRFHGHDSIPNWIKFRLDHERIFANRIKAILDEEKARGPDSV